jgi:hypothetical protein
MQFQSGVLVGAGLALFILFVVAQGVTVEITGWVRVGIGAAGLVLVVAGWMLRGRGKPPTLAGESRV